MGKSRAIMTDTERERLAGLEDVEEIRVYQAKSRIRRRINEELTFDVEILADHHPELLEELQEVVCSIQSKDSDELQEDGEIEAGESPHVDDTPTPEPDETTVRDGEPDENSNLAGVDFPSNLDRYECITAAEAARDVIRDRDGATKKEMVQQVMPEHPLGYDVDEALAKIEAGERYRGAWWRRVVKNALINFSDVQKPKRGASEWKYVEKKQ